MTTHRRTWQRAEQRIAALLGARRQPGSGSGGRPDQTRSDSTHARLFLEVKYRDRHTVRSLWEATKALARAEGKVAVLGLVDKGRPGALLVVHQDDLPALLAEFADAAEIPADVDPPPDWPPRVGRSAEPEDLGRGAIERA